MSRNDWLNFEIYVMELCESGGCRTAKDYEDMSEQLHEHIENAIYDMCFDNNIDDYEPCY